MYSCRSSGLNDWNRNVQHFIISSLEKESIRDNECSENNQKYVLLTLNDYLIGPPIERYYFLGLNIEKYETAIDSFSATIFHNKNNIYESNKLTFLVNFGMHFILFSKIINHEYFRNRSLDIFLLCI